MTSQREHHSWYCCVNTKGLSLTA